MDIDENVLVDMNKDVEVLVDLLDSKLHFKTKDGEFEGILKFIMITKHRVLFEHAYYLPTRKYMGTMHVTFSDFLSYKLLQRSNTVVDCSKFDSVGEEILNGESEKLARIDTDDSIDVDNTNVQVNEILPPHLQNICPDDYCFINSVCSTFFVAINDISGFKNIGVSFHGSDLSRKGSLSLICIATPKCVFVFDIDKMGITAFRQGIQRIFEDENIQKIVHDCREPADCLKHLFQTTLNNVFDTQLTDYLISMQRSKGEVIFKYVSSLDNCLVRYLKVPQQLLYNRNKFISKDAEIQFYNMRPITDEFRNILIKSSIYLLSLQKKQEQLFLYPFEQAVNLSLNIVREASGAEVLKMSEQCGQVAPRYLSECITTVQFCNRN